MTATQKVRTCLWFDTEAEEAANFYTQACALRGVNLLGIDSVVSPQEERQEARHRLGQEQPPDNWAR